jgi:hypothetical protein
VTEGAAGSSPGVGAPTFLSPITWTWLRSEATYESSKVDLLFCNRSILLDPGYDFRGVEAGWAGELREHLMRGYAQRLDTIVFWSAPISHPQTHSLIEPG